jgi:hypothetical protein
MLTQAATVVFAADAEDRKVYTSWLRNTFAIYGAVVAVGIGLVALQASDRMINIATYMGDAVVMAAP